eukprot:g874.t1
MYGVELVARVRNHIRKKGIDNAEGLAAAIARSCCGLVDAAASDTEVRLYEVLDEGLGTTCLLANETSPAGRLIKRKLLSRTSDHGASTSNKKNVRSEGSVAELGAVEGGDESEEGEWSEHDVPAPAAAQAGFTQKSRAKTETDGQGLLEQVALRALTHHENEKRARASDVHPDPDLEAHPAGGRARKVFGWELNATGTSNTSGGAPDGLLQMGGGSLVVHRAEEMLDGLETPREHVAPPVEGEDGPGGGPVQTGGEASSAPGARESVLPNAPPGAAGNDGVATIVGTTSSPRRPSGRRSGRAFHSVLSAKRMSAEDLEAALRHWHGAKIALEADPVARRARALNRLLRSRDVMASLQKRKGDRREVFCVDALSAFGLAARLRASKPEDGARRDSEGQERERRDDVDVDKSSSLLRDSFHLIDNDTEGPAFGAATFSAKQEADLIVREGAVLADDSADRIAGVSMLHKAFYRASVVDPRTGRVRCGSLGPNRRETLRQWKGRRQLRHAETLALGADSSRAATGRLTGQGDGEVELHQDEANKTKSIFPDPVNEDFVSCGLRAVRSGARGRGSMVLDEEKKLVAFPIHLDNYDYVSFPDKSGRKAWKRDTSLSGKTESEHNSAVVDQDNRKQGSSDGDDGHLLPATSSYDLTTVAGFLVIQSEIVAYPVFQQHVVTTLQLLAELMSEEWNLLCHRKTGIVAEGVAFALVQTLEDAIRPSGGVRKSHVLPVLCAVAKDLVQCERVAIWAVEDEEHKVAGSTGSSVLVLREQAGGVLLKGTKVHKEAGFLGAAVKAGRPVCVFEHAHKDGRYNPFIDVGGEFVKHGSEVFQRGYSLENVISVPIYGYAKTTPEAEVARYSTGAPLVSSGLRLALQEPSPPVGENEDVARMASSTDDHQHPAPGRQLPAEMRDRRTKHAALVQNVRKVRSRRTAAALENLEMLKKRGPTLVASPPRQVVGSLVDDDAETAEDILNSTRREIAESMQGVMSRAIYDMSDSDGSTPRAATDERAKTTGEQPTHSRVLVGVMQFGNFGVFNNSLSSVLLGGHLRGGLHSVTTSSSVGPDHVARGRSFGNKPMKNSSKASLSSVGSGYSGASPSPSLNKRLDSLSPLHNDRSHVAVVQLATALAHYPAHLALHIAPAVASIHAERRQKIRFWYFVEKLGRCLTLQQVLQAVDTHLPLIFGCDGASLLIHDANLQTVRGYNSATGTSVLSSSTSSGLGSGARGSAGVSGSFPGAPAASARRESARDHVATFAALGGLGGGGGGTSTGATVTSHGYGPGAALHFSCIADAIYIGNASAAVGLSSGPATLDAEKRKELALLRELLPSLSASQCAGGTRRRSRVGKRNGKSATARTDGSGVAVVEQGPPIENLVAVPVLRKQQGLRLAKSSTIDGSASRLGTLAGGSTKSRIGPSADAASDIVAVLLLANKRTTAEHGSNGSGGRGLVSSGFGKDDLIALRFLSNQIGAHFLRLKVDFGLEAAFDSSYENVDANVQSLLTDYMEQSGYHRDASVVGSQIPPTLSAAQRASATAATNKGQQTQVERASGDPAPASNVRNTTEDADTTSKPDRNSITSSASTEPAVRPWYHTTSDYGGYDSLLQVFKAGGDIGAALCDPKRKDVVPDVISYDLCCVDLVSKQSQNSLIQRLFQHIGVGKELYEVFNLDTYCDNVRDLYAPVGRVPYHNFYHGLSVAQVSTLLLADARLVPRLQKIDLFAVIVASVGHDAGHRGFTNQYEVASRSDLAFRYNDLSVLENHHASMTWQNLARVVLVNSQETLAALQKLVAPGEWLPGRTTAGLGRSKRTSGRSSKIIYADADEKETSLAADAPAAPPPTFNELYELLRRRVVKSILGTDMKFHGEHIESARSLSTFFGNEHLESSSDEGCSTSSSEPSEVEMVDRSEGAARRPSGQEVHMRSTRSSVEEGDRVRASDQNLSPVVVGKSSEVCEAGAPRGVHQPLNEQNEQELQRRARGASSKQSSASSNYNKGSTSSSLQQAPELPEHVRQHVCELFVHTADIGNMSMPLEQAIRWRDMVCLEFAQQQARERENGWPVTLFPDGLDTAQKRSVVQLGFINFLVMPLYKAVHALWPIHGSMRRTKIAVALFEKVKSGELLSDEMPSEEVYQQLAKEVDEGNRSSS